MHIVTINGSARPGNFTGKALVLTQHELAKNDKVTVTAIEPGQMKLAIPGSGMDDRDSKRLQEMLIAADGVILATPEYHGTFSSLIKLTLENIGFPSALKNKPVVLLGVAAGRIGAIKSLEHLRSVCSHIGALALPGVVSVANVQKVFDADGNCLDADVEAFVRGLATDLVKYIYETRCPKLSFEEWVRT